MYNPVGSTEPLQNYLLKLEVQPKHMKKYLAIFAAAAVAALVIGCSNSGEGDTGTTTGTTATTPSDTTTGTAGTAGGTATTTTGAATTG
jgi:hypothetical protein